MTRRRTSSRNGVNFGVGVLGGSVELEAADDALVSSTNGTNPAFAAVGAFFCVDTGTAGGGISPGPGSRNTAILELDPEAAVPVEAAASLFVLPACFIVEPTIFFTSGTFSLILVFRVPNSFHSLDPASAVCASSPVGSTNICRRPFGCADGLPEGVRDEAGRMV